MSTLSFTKTSGYAFKTRVQAGQDIAYAGQILPLAYEQDIPGAFYNSTSNFVLGVANGTSGLAITVPD